MGRDKTMLLEDPVAYRAAFGEEAADPPEPPHTRGDGQLAGGIAVPRGVAQGVSQVVQVNVEAVIRSRRDRLRAVGNDLVDHVDDPRRQR